MPNMKPFKISDLTQMTASEISKDDLLLVSDTENPNNGKKYESKSLSLGTLQNNISDKMTPKIQKTVEDNLGGKEEVKKIQQFVSNFISDDPSGLELTIDCGDSTK